VTPNELIVDSFAGGGGASLGIQWALGRSPDIAINHDKEAIALHAANHPDSLHLAEDVWKVDPITACAGRPVGLMWLSPDCKHFSKAKGGKPVEKKIRGLAWVAIRWAAAVRPRVIVLENVEEFQTWGPVLRETNRPCPVRRGQTFKAFIRKLTRMGYAVQWRELRACDYGAPTIRKRLFLIARCDGQAIVWPTPTHGKGRSLPWRTAAECIDWSIACPSIFLTREEARAIGVKRPLAPATMRRIARGIKKFVLDNPRPFIVGVGGRQGQSPERSVEQPLQTITSKADSAIVVPSLVSLTHHGERKPLPVTEPFPTITGAHRGELGLVAPTMVQIGYGEKKGQAPRALDIEQPLGTIVGGGVKHALVAAFMAQHNTGNAGHQMEFPVSTIIGKGCTQGLVAAHIAKQYGDRIGSSIEEPLHTVVANGVHHALVASHIKRDFGTSTGAAVDTPLPTITSDGGGHASLVASFLTAYYGNEKDGGSLFDPMRTVTSKDRLALVTVNSVEYVIVDIGMRMLVPRELYRAQGFPDSYKIEIEYNGKPLTKTAQVRMVGNSVSPEQARAIIAALFDRADSTPEELAA
jgi:DNA (cytosine-5)-methyltransferase 1